jgi:hypothetical protein
MNNLNNNHVSADLNSVIFFLMLIQPFLGATSLSFIQIFTETLLIILLTYSFLNQKQELNHYILIILLIFVSIFSFALNNINVFLLDFKIYLLSILTLMFAAKFQNVPRFFFKLIFLLLVTYPFLPFFLNLWFLESLPFFEKKATYLNYRPVGILGNPHSSAQLTSLFFFYYFHKKKYFTSIIAILAVILYSSTTALLAISGQIIYNLVFYILKIKIKPLFFILIVLFFFYLSINIVNYIQDNSASDVLRISSATVILPMLFDVNYYNGIFNFYPISSDSFITEQEKTFANVGNEIGLIKIILEGGIFLAMFYLYNVFKKTQYFFIFLFLTMLHYTYIMIQPLFLFVCIIINKQIYEKNTSYNN